MGKRVKHLLAAAILAACLLAQTGVCYGDETAAQNGQAAGESQTDQNSQTTAVQNGQETGDVNPPAIEQVYVNLPEVTVYGSGWPEEGMEAFLGQESLTYEAPSPRPGSRYTIIFFWMCPIPCRILISGESRRQSAALKERSMPRTGWRCTPSGRRWS